MNFQHEFLIAYLQLRKKFQQQINKRITLKNTKSNMSSPKVYTSQQFEQINSNKSCPRCHEEEDTFIELGCKHKYCIVCITFAYLKYKNTLDNNQKVKCLECQRVSELDGELLELINQIIMKELGPIVKNDNNESRMSINQSTNPYGNSNNSQDLSAHKIRPSHNHRSDESSMFVNGGNTPEKKNKHIYSKCQSPKHLHQRSQVDPCSIHPTEQISYICMNCSFKPLCYKCIKSNKHSNHEVKIIKKAIELIHQKISLINLQAIQSIENIELHQKRLYDRKLIFQDRIEKNMKEIKNVFVNLQKKIQQKSIETIGKYREFYQDKIAQIDQKSQKTTETLENIKKFQEKIKDFDHSIKSNDQLLKTSLILQRYDQIKEMQRQLYSSDTEQYFLSQKKNKYFDIYENILDPIYIQTSQLKKSLSSIVELIENVNINSFHSNFSNQNHQNQFKLERINFPREKFNETVQYASIMKSDVLFNKNKTLGMRNCSSRQRVLKNQNLYEEENASKKMRMNVPKSLNTSRDKRDKKHNAKTQQDQKRFKSKGNYKTQTNTQAKHYTNIENINGKELPQYISKCIEKHKMISSLKRKVSPFNSGTVYLMQNLQSSKNNSKILSKNSNILRNDDLNRKATKQQIHSGGHKQRYEKKKAAFGQVKHKKWAQSSKQKK